MQEVNENAVLLLHLVYDLKISCGIQEEITCKWTKNPRLRQIDDHFIVLFNSQSFFVFCTLKIGIWLQSRNGSLQALMGDISHTHYIFIHVPTIKLIKIESAKLLTRTSCNFLHVESVISHEMRSEPLCVVVVTTTSNTALSLSFSIYTHTEKFNPFQLNWIIHK